MNEKRSSFSTKIGFIFAAASSAVGLGNLWRFPYLAAKYGGGIFLLVYICLAVSFGFVLMTTEIAIGRKTRLSAIGAYKKLDKRFGFLGVLSLLIPVIISPYYCVIGGWVLKYATEFVRGNLSNIANDSYFTDFISQSGSPIVFFLIYMLISATIVIMGVNKGIERASRLLMPLLILFSIIISIYSLLQPGAIDGLIYYIKPDFSKFSIKTIIAALGQLFYSMSLAMGIMVTYGSYMKRENHIENSVRQIEIFDTLIAFLAGLMIIPAVFVFSGGDADALGKGPGLMFITLPKVFDSMAMGGIFGTLFFLLVAFAAVTSSVSLIEAIVSMFMDCFHWARKKSCFVVIGIIVVVGIPVSLGFGVLDFINPFGLGSLLDFFDFISNSILMPLLELLVCLFIGYVVKPKVLIDEIEWNGPFKAATFFTIVIKYVAPVCLFIIFVSSILEALGVFSL